MHDINPDPPSKTAPDLAPNILKSFNTAPMCGLPIPPSHLTSNQLITPAA